MSGRTRTKRRSAARRWWAQPSQQANRVGANRTGRNLSRPYRDVQLAALYDHEGPEKRTRTPAKTPGCRDWSRRHQQRQHVAQDDTRRCQIGDAAMPHILITGTAGVLGSRLRHHLQALGWPLTPRIAPRTAAQRSSMPTLPNSATTGTADLPASTWSYASLAIQGRTPRRNPHCATTSTQRTTWWRHAGAAASDACFSPVATGCSLGIGSKPRRSRPRPSFIPSIRMGSPSWRASVSAARGANTAVCRSLPCASAIASTTTRICRGPTWAWDSGDSACGCPAKICAKASKRRCWRRTRCGSAFSILSRTITACAGASMMQRRRSATCRWTLRRRSARGRGPNERKPRCTHAASSKRRKRR